MHLSSTTPANGWLRSDFDLVEKVLADAPAVDKFFSIPPEEFAVRQKRVYEGLERAGLKAALAFSDEHYDGDVPYLGGNTNVHIEQVAAVLGKEGLTIVTGMEGAYLAEQLAERSGAKVARLEMLKLAGEEYTLSAARLEDVIEEAAGGKVHQIGLLSPRQVVPAAIIEYLEALFGRENVVDCQQIYQEIKYEKSANEMRLTRDANAIADAMMRAMLAVLKPGMLETQIAAWGYFVGCELGAEGMGWDVMVGANTANRTLIGKALNREIREGDFVHLGVAPKRDGLNSCVRRSCVVAKKPSAEQEWWLRFIEEAYGVGLKAFEEVTVSDLPGCRVEEALIDFYRSQSSAVSRRLGREVALDQLKPYSSVHNAGYTECQEFYGALTLESKEKLGRQVVLMLDVALRGIHESWKDVVIPGMDYLVIENTCGKFGTRLEEFNALPHNVQPLVGYGIAG